MLDSAALSPVDVRDARHARRPLRRCLIRWVRWVRETPSFHSVPSPSNVLPIAFIALAVLAANLPAVLHLVTTNPLVIDGYLAPARSGWLPGLPTIDPNAGYTTQALGHLSALDWIHGHVPWWNPQEGVGSPLAGEMQSGAFFPPTLLLAIPQGLLLMQLLLETAAGWSTYFLVRRLGVGRSLSVSAGVAFGTCGTFAWFAHAPIRPIALLPLSLVGVERALDAARDHRGGGWRLLAVALGLSVLAGFPETTFINGLFVAWWGLIRILGPGRTSWRPLLAKLAAGGLVGTALSAPLLVAFADYLPAADIGAHGGALATVALPSAGLTQLILPYSLGPIFGFHSSLPGPDLFAFVWDRVGGYLSVTLIAAGLVGLIGHRQRSLRIGLGLWVVVCLLRTYGFPPVVHFLAVIPGLRATAFYRYADPSWEFAVVVLAALGLDDIARTLTRRRVLVGGAILAGIGSAWAVATAWPWLTSATGATPSQGTHRHIFAVGSLLVAVVLLTLLVLGGSWAGSRSGSTSRERIRRFGRLVVAGTVCLESMVLLGFTYLSAPPPTHLETGSVRWLQTHLGPYRFATLGPIQPAYGSYFGIAEVNVNDLPIPKSWSKFVTTGLDPNTSAIPFTGGYRSDPRGPTPAEEYSVHLDNFESIGVRYVVEPSNGLDVLGSPFPAIGSPSWPAGPRLVYRDTLAEVWELPDASPVFSLDNHAGLSNASVATQTASKTTPCSVTGHGWNRATVVCSHPTVVIRRVQYLSGWSATVGRISVSVQPDQAGPPGLFQQVSVPKGTSALTFSYLPPHEELASTAALGAVLVLSVPFFTGLRRRRPRAPK
jgi:hypothetical protein